MKRKQQGYVVWTASREWSPSRRSRRLLALPWRVVDAIRMNRRVVPGIHIYVLAAVVGLGLGLASAFALDWPWWPFPLGALALTVVVSAATAFTSPVTRSYTMEELHTVMSAVSSDYHERRRAEYAKRFTTADVPLYGLEPAWRGLRYFDTLIDDTRQFTCWGLTHRRDDDAELEVMTCRTEQTRAQVIDEIWLSRADEEFATLPERTDVTWEALPVEVDGEQYEFALLAGSTEWWAYHNIGGQGIVLHGRQGFPRAGIRLARMRDLGPYLSGHAEMERRLTEQ